MLEGRTFYSLSWSKSWKEQYPWSLDGKLLPYVGITKNDSQSVTIVTLGPAALIRVKI